MIAPAEHARFGRMLEFDRNGPPLNGTDEQQRAIRDLIARHAPYGTPLDQTLYRLDVAVNENGRNYIPVSFVDFAVAGKWWLGFTTPTMIQLAQTLDPEHIAGTFFHELGHLVGWYLPAWPGRSEDAAHAFADWVADGQDTDSDVWRAIVGP